MPPRLGFVTPTTTARGRDGFDRPLRPVMSSALPAGGDALGVALGAALDDHFVKRFGNLASIVVVRCKLSDEGATAIARGVYASDTLTHVDLSGPKDEK